MSDVSHIFGEKMVPMILGAFRLIMPASTDLNIFINKRDDKGRIRDESGYVLNINNDRINTFYRRFKIEKNIPVWCPLGDDERYEFETRVLTALKIDYKLLPGWQPNYQKGEQNEKQPA